MTRGQEYDETNPAESYVGGGVDLTLLEARDSRRNAGGAGGLQRAAAVRPHLGVWPDIRGLAARGLLPTTATA